MTTAAYSNMIKRVLNSSPREEDLLVTLCESLNWGLDINHAKGKVTIKTNKATYGFNDVNDALNWFYKCGNMQKASAKT